MSGYLELADGAVVPVRDGLVLGRVAACDVVVADSKASRRHARLIAEAGVVEIEDMGSSNGTLLNGKPVDRRMLRDGDRVEIGQTVIVYREGALPGRSAAAPARASGGAALLDDDDDDLFASAGPSGAAPVAPPTDEAVLGGDDELPASRAPSPSAPPPPAADVVEFEDEVVEVQNVPPPRPEPAVEVRQAGRPASGAGAADPVQASSGRVLQYSKKKGGSGLLGDDLGQMSGGTKWLLVLLAVAAGGGVVYAIMSAMR